MLAQTYSPLEIIISDDCSTDRTWEILQKIKDNYTGQHQLAIHRNEKNLRIIRNLCTAFHLAHGELVIKADGDDISMPNRVEKMVEHWLSTNKEAWCLCSAYQKISVEGDIIGHQSVPFTGLDTRSIRDICFGNGYFYLGAASSYRRDVIVHFPTADYERACDDSVFTVRCAMLGKLYVIGDELIKYRIGCGETTNRTNYRKTMAKGITYCAVSQQQLLLDLERIKERLSPDDYRQFRESLESFYQHCQEVLKLYNGRTFRERLIGAREARCGKTFSIYNLIVHIMLLPPALADFCFAVLGRLQKILKRKAKPS